jgi:hypothetical protein
MPDVANASAADAELILRLYDMRREAEMRKARNWFAAEFWPNSFEDVQKIMLAFGAPQNAWFRQVSSYWDMAAALVNRGALNAALFYDTCGEGYFVYTKMKPFLPQLRTAMNAPEYLRNLEKVVENTPEGRERISRLQQNFARWAQMREQAVKEAAK